jgi:hypothetical protein
MVSTLAHTSRAPGEAASGPSSVRIGIAAGRWLLVLPLLVVVSVRLAHPGDRTAAQILAAETVLIAAAQVAISIRVILRTPTPGIVRALIPALVAGLVVAAADVAGSSFAFHTPPTAEILSVVAYDVVLGVLLALPVIVVLGAASRCRVAASKSDVDASPNALIAAYRRVLADGACRAVPWHVCALLTQQLLRRHVRRTLEAAQRGYAKWAVERGLDKAEARDRQAVDDYLLSVPPISRVVPIPTVATIFVLWKIVPMLVAVAATVAAWFGGGHWGWPTSPDPSARRSRMRSRRLSSTPSRS